jgi:GNAT superfamily N-acetyltransferase
MISVISDDLATYRSLLYEYEDHLPRELRHEDLALSPDIAFVAINDGEPCGIVAFIASEAPAARLRHLYVRPSHRNLGVARALMAAFTDAARERGCNRIILDTDKERLAPAYALYRSLGFAECGPHGPVDYATPTFMELPLT